MELEAVDAAAIHKRAAEQGLAVLASVAVNESTDSPSESAVVRDRARDFLERCVAPQGWELQCLLGSSTPRSAGG